MREEEMLDLVREGADLPDRHSARFVLEGTLRTLGERIPPAAAAHFAAQLPDHAAKALQGEESPAAEDGERGEKFGLATFAGRLAWRTETDEETAMRRAAAVFDVLDAAVAPELMEKLAQVLPHDIDELLPSARATGSSGS